MSKVTSKFQVSIPKALASRVGVEPGDEIEWSVAGDALRVSPTRAAKTQLSVAERLALFDAATKRQAARKGPARGKSSGRGWTREGLYRRGRTR